MQATTTTTAHRPAPIARTPEPVNPRELAAAQLARETGIGYGLALMMLLAHSSEHPELHIRFAFGPLA